MIETDFQKKALAWLKLQPDVTAINIHGGGWSGKGAPDIIACCCGRFIALELKVGKNGMQPDQKVWKTKIERSGGRHCCPRTLSEVKDIIEEVRNLENQ